MTKEEIMQKIITNQETIIECLKEKVAIYEELLNQYKQMLEK